MRSDLRYALRLLWRSPGFTFAVIFVLALGIGANSAIFSAVDQLVIRPLPYPGSARLTMLWEDFSAFGVPRNRVSPATFLDWRRRSQVFSDMAAWAGPATRDLAGSGPPEEVLGQSVTANLLSLLGTPPLLGRTFRPEEEHEDSDLVVLSYTLWQRRYSGDPHLVGRTILMDGSNHTVIGIMPPGFQFPDRQTEFWAPIGMSPQLLARRNSHFLKVVGRIRPGRSVAAAQSEMNAVAHSLAAEFPASNRNIGITVVPLKDEFLGESRTAFLILLAAAACVLLIACANVGTLLLVRAASRRAELAMRAALGAHPLRLLRQILTENLLLATAGGTLGLGLAAWGMAALERMIPTGLAGHLRLDWRMAAFSAALSLSSGLLFGLAPALQLSRARLASRTVVSRGGRLRDSLVAAELALALVLVTGAGLLIQTLLHLRAVDPGFRSAGILTAEINVPYAKFHGQNQRFYQDVLDRVRAIPGVQSAGLTSDLPYTSRGNTMGIRVEGRLINDALGQDVLFRLVSAGYLETTGARLLAGRFLGARDGPDAPPAVVINETLARQYWPNENPLGRRIDTGTGNGGPRWMTIVGVVRDLRERGLDLALKGAVYVPFAQTTITFFQPSEIAVRTAATDPLRFAKDLQQAVWSIDPAQPVANLRTMDDIVAGEMANRSSVLTLLGAFAALALALAALGIYAVLSYVVSQRTREIGLRMAIGARRLDIVRHVLGHAARVTAAGLATGLAIAAAVTRLLSALLYGVSPLDPAIFCSVPLLLALVALAAAFLPTRRAAAVDPAIALRQE